MAKRSIEESTLIAIADAIREKGGTTAGLDPEGEMPQAILDIKGAEIAERDNPSGGKTVYINSEAPEEAVLPEGFTRLKWIQSDGRQYVNTQFKPNQDTRVVIDCKLDTYVTNGSFIFGVRSPGTTRGFAAALVTGPNRSYYNYGSQLDYANIPDIYSRMVIEANGASAEFLAGADKATITHDPAAFTAEYPLAIGVLIEGGSVYDRTQWIGKIYSGQIYDDDTIVRNYIPCLNASGEAGLWDTVTQAFFGDAAGVGFIAGPVVLDYTLPEGFEELEYIESTAGQYINTRIYPNQNTRIVIDAQGSENTTINQVEMYVGAGDSSSGAWFMFGKESGAAWRDGVYYGTQSASSTINTQENYLARKVVDFNKNIVDFGNGKDIHTFNVTSFSVNTPIAIFGVLKGSSLTYSAKIRCFSCQIYDNGTIVRYYVPCRTNTGEVGLWDAVNSVFYGDAAGVGFIAGPKVSVSKVVLEDEVLIDLTGDTISPETVLAGFIGHDKTGAQFVGELAQKSGYQVAAGTITVTSVNPLTISGLPFTPIGACVVSVFKSRTYAYNHGRITGADTTSNRYAVADLDSDGNARASYRNLTAVTKTRGSISITAGSAFYEEYQYVVWGE